jgi:hypothetical protein
MGNHRRAVRRVVGFDTRRDVAPGAPTTYVATLECGHQQQVGPGDIPEWMQCETCDTPTPKKEGATPP